MISKLLFYITFFLAFSPSIQALVTEKGSPNIAIDSNAIRAHMAFLADDLLEGREAGTRGEALAALYIKSTFEAAGLLPAGNNSSFYQRFSVRKSRLAPSGVKFRLTNAAGKQTSFTNGDDITVFSSPYSTDQEVSAELVFAGSGIVAPEFNIDDYAAIDVRGKIAVVLGGPAAFLPPSEAAHYGSVSQQKITASQQGAIGLIVIYTPALEARWQFSRFKSILLREEIDWLGIDGKPKNEAPNIQVRAYVTGEAASYLFDGTGHSVAELIEEATEQSPKGFSLKTRVHLTRSSLHNDELSSVNVAALIEGSDPKLKNELVVVSAHYDHLGIGIPVNGDAIFNGAGDNALGVSALLELAKEIAGMTTKPKRSILFVAVSAEEKGLIGSDYFAQYPPVAEPNIVANINIDGGLPFYDFRDVIGFGIEHSELYEHLENAAHQLGLKVATDPFPEQGIFTRSDQYSFAKRGIPSVFLFTGFTAIDGREVGYDYWKMMTAEHGHKPSDDLSLGWDYQVIAKFTDLARRFVIETANAATAPLWYKNSRMGQLFSPETEKAISVPFQPVYE